MTNNVTQTILQTALDTIPNKTVTIRQDEPPWLYHNIKRMLRKRNRIHKKAKQTNRQGHWTVFRQFCNKCINYVCSAKSRFYNKTSNKLLSTNLTTKNLWKTIKLMTGFSLKTSSIPP